MLDKATFYANIRGGPLFPVLYQDQVNGIDQILDCWNGGPLGLFQPPVYDAMLAYMLATVYHETARAMQPVREGDWPGHHVSDAWRRRNLYRYYPYYGRGLVQLTWRSNYQLATQFLRKFYPADASKIDLVNFPDQALNPTYAVAILFHGMSTGMFTGRSLHDYIYGSHIDFIDARRIINGMDRAWTIAGYANEFLTAVEKGTAAYEQTHR